MSTTSKLSGPLPVYRITTIMKSSSDAENIGKESCLMMAKAAELFIKMLAKEGLKLSSNGKKLDYKHVAEVVNREERYEFLRDIMPRKITYAEYKKLQREKKRDENGTSGGSSSDDDSGSDTGSSSSNE